MPENKYEINSVSDFLNSINDLITKNNLEDKTIFFRGHRSCEWKSIPGIGRDETPGLLENEHLIFRDFLARYDDEFQTCRSTFDILTKMQHYELPTRLLDVTTNALVALYFACLKEPMSEPDEDGEVLIYAVPNEFIKHFDSDSVAILSNVAKCKPELNVKMSSLIEAYPELKEKKTSASFSECLSNIVIDEKWNNKFKEEFNKDKDNEDKDNDNDNYDKLSYLCHQVKEERSHFREGEVFPPHLGRVWAVRAKKNNPRIIAQSGDFFLFGLGVDEKKFEDDKLFLTKQQLAALPGRWIIAGERPMDTEGEKVRILIKKDEKRNILKELEFLGIKESTLLPEMTVYAKELKNKYGVK
ncbi:FRG domain-containing protein [Porphyromonas cangingivalis]|uniref:FRG domain-containing protein n=1 Tax=Porphyromonas cangingivalis TaxID=36874 RepID=UPI00051CDE32|nr:FRG domain-containing protein [Porphyromonas cangingivalis]KGL50263.1 hypothetical protein HQ34_01120 [Porphyromonas cangingivalis]